MELSIDRLWMERFHVFSEEQQPQSGTDPSEV